MYRKTNAPRARVGMRKIVRHPRCPRRWSSTMRPASAGRMAPATVAVLPSSTSSLARRMRSLACAGATGSTPGPSSWVAVLPTGAAGMPGSGDTDPGGDCAGDTDPGSDGVVASAALPGGGVAVASATLPAGMRLSAAAQVKLAPSNAGWARRARPVMCGLDKEVLPRVCAYGVSCRAHVRRPHASIRAPVGRYSRISGRFAPSGPVQSGPAVGPPLVSICGDDSAGSGNPGNAR